MNKRPRSVTVIGCLFLAAGTIGLAYHVTEFKAQGPFDYDLVWVCFVRLLAVLGGAFVLRGSNWARWLLAVWLGYHVFLGFLHSLWGGLVHTVLFFVVVYFLFRPQASAYFRGLRAESPPKTDDSPAV